MLGTPPEETTKAHLTYMPIYGAMIQRGSSTPTDEPSHPELPPGGLSSH